MQPWRKAKPMAKETIWHVRVEMDDAHERKLRRLVREGGRTASETMCLALDLFWVAVHHEEEIRYERKRECRRRGSVKQSPDPIAIAKSVASVAAGMSGMSKKG